MNYGVVAVLLLIIVILTWLCYRQGKQKKCLKKETEKLQKCVHGLLMLRGLETRHGVCFFSAGDLNNLRDYLEFPPLYNPRMVTLYAKSAEYLSEENFWEDVERARGENQRNCEASIIYRVISASADRKMNEPDEVLKSIKRLDGMFEAGVHPQQVFAISYEAWQSLRTSALAGAAEKFAERAINSSAKATSDLSAVSGILNQLNLQPTDLRGLKAAQVNRLEEMLDALEGRTSTVKNLDVTVPVDNPEPDHGRNITSTSSLT